MLLLRAGRRQNANSGAAAATNAATAAAVQSWRVELARLLAELERLMLQLQEQQQPVGRNAAPPDSVAARKDSELQEQFHHIAGVVRKALSQRSQQSALAPVILPPPVIGDNGQIVGLRAVQVHADITSAAEAEEMNRLYEEMRDVQSMFAELQQCAAESADGLQRISTNVDCVAASVSGATDELATVRRRQRR